MPDNIVFIGSVPIRISKEGAFVTTPHDHQKVHLGDLFTFDHYGTVASGGTLNYLITPNATLNLHSSFAITVSGAARIYLYENPAGSAGTAIPLYNLNRDSTNTISATVKHTPTISDAGTISIVNGRYIAAGAGVPNRIGGELREDIEIILDAGKTYLYRYENISGAAGTISFYGVVYEEESG